jgi:hypothetical protein
MSAWGHTKIRQSRRILFLKMPYRLYHNVQPYFGIHLSDYHLHKVRPDPWQIGGTLCSEPFPQYQDANRYCSPVELPAIANLRMVIFYGFFLLRQPAPAG